MSYTDWEAATKLSAQCGFSYAALLPAEPVAGYAPSAEAVRQGIVHDPALLLPGARSVLVVAMPFVWHSPWPMGYGEVSAFYFTSQRAHEAIQRLGEVLSAQGVSVSVKQNLPQKRLGERAGIGLLGRNTLLRNAAWGSCFALRVLVTDIPPGPPPKTMPAPKCGSCRRCVQACPTGALRDDGTLDTTLCLRSYMMSGETVPEALRPHMGVRLLGCEICQRACPHNGAMPVSAPDVSAFSLDALLCGKKRDRDEIARHIGWNEARLQRIQTQATLAAGNSGDPQYLPALQALVHHERYAVAEHARWAINRLKGE